VAWNHPWAAAHVIITDGGDLGMA